MANKRLANIRTRKETGFDYVVGNINIQTPYGKKQLQSMQPYFPEQEEELRDELSKTSQMLSFIREYPKHVTQILEILMEIKDISLIIDRSAGSVLTVVDLYEVKNALIQMSKMSTALAVFGEAVPKEFILEDTTDLLDELDPEKSRINTFYIYDEFSEKLAQLRAKKREVEIAIRRQQRKTRDELKEEFGITLTPKFELSVAKANSSQLEKVRSIEALEEESEDYMCINFKLKPTPAVYELQQEMEDINLQIDDEEEIVRSRLSKLISEHAEVLKLNCFKIGRIDLHIAKAYFADEHSCVMPDIVREHVVEFEEGRHIQVEDILHAKGKEYCPISVSLAEGVTCITGANMGGKTVSLKLVGLVAILAQYGFFVPCSKAKIGLSNYMQILIGDSQSVERGLSSFGSEMEELKEILDNSGDRSLILVDEIASGTNPLEATALTRAIVEYFKAQPYIVLMTTHFEAVTLGDVVNLQVVGLSGTDFSLLEREIKYAKRKERINIISKYMDYRLVRIEKGGNVPKDALSIAMMLGIDTDIIKRAKEYINEEMNYKD